MTNTQHTPGPWELHEGGTSVNGADGHLVASCGFLPYRNVWDSRANARLIAAAPDVLEALEHLLQSYEELTGHNGDTSIVCGSAHAAIAKARGVGQ